MKNHSVRLVMMLAFACISTAFAQSYPNRPIKVIIPWPPGQATDLAARMVSEKLVPVLGQPLVMDNKPGAGGTIGSEAASKTPADGYTLLAGSSGPISISPNVQKVPYDPLKDFAPICLLAVNPYVLVVNSSVPAKNVPELIALLRANPGKYSFSSSGSGASSHLASVLFNSMANVSAVHVPYKGSSPSVTDLVSGQVAYTIETVPGIISFVKSGRLRALAVSTAKRSTAMPELATIADDLPGYEMSGWIGLMAPAGMPREISGRLSREVRKILEIPEIKERFLALGLEPAGNTPEEYAEFLKRQNDRYASIVKQADLKLD
ncbi:MAG TPA: tripartite tricarboxylate transporter substrate binding protein [Burkholderiales bacterium]|nr:tripartite tricarboxylate transporter substrate binding protein [Burkholderiales bacterium]